jgi:hypothetical protein
VRTLHCGEAVAEDAANEKWIAQVKMYFWSIAVVRALPLRYVKRRTHTPSHSRIPFLLSLGAV